MTFRLTRQALAPGALFCFAAASCADALPPRAPPPRGSLGEELYGVICDRVGGQSLHEDLTGASFRAVCHRVNGAFASTVDASLLPALVDGQQDVHGNPVTLATQRADRKYGVARIERLAQNRASLVAALDATFPDVPVTIKDVASADATQSCNPAPGGGQGRLHTELANLLARLPALYDDGTIPQSTEALGSVVTAYNKATAAQQSWAHFNARAGYRPVDVALGVARPVLAYPKLRDFTNATVKLLSPDSDPYNPMPKLDAQGVRIPVAGPLYPQLAQLMAAAHFELSNETDDPVPSPLALSLTPDAAVGGRAVLNRPRTDLELMMAILHAEDPSFASDAGGPRFIVRRDPRGYAALGGKGVPSPFIDEGDGLPAIDPVTWQLQVKGGGLPPSPFFAVGATAPPSRDGAARALYATGQQIYSYVDTSQTFASRFLAHLRGVVSHASLVDSNPAHAHETVMNLLAGAYVLFGQRAGQAGAPLSTKAYGGPSLTYGGYRPVPSPLGDLVYALGQILADPTADATLVLSSTLMKSNAGDVARVAGDALWAKDQANADTTATLPPASTLWDELIDLVIAVAQDTSPSTDPKGRRLLEDILTAFAQPASLGLSKAFASQAGNVDAISYDRNNLNGPAVNLTKPGSAPMTPADRTKPDSGANRSQLQRFAQLVHDTNGVTLCNKEGAILHGVGVPLLNIANVCASTAGNTGQLCCVTPSLSCFAPDSTCGCTNARQFHECEVFKIDNLARFYLDAIAKKASLYFRNRLLRDGIGGACPDPMQPALCPAGIGAVSVGLNEQSSGIGLHLDPTSAPDDTYNDTPAKQTGPAAPGFWDPVGTVWNPVPAAAADGGVSAPTLLRPKPGWLNRLAGFDLVNDSPMPATAPATNNYLTNHFIADLQGNHIGTAACPERIIADPCASDMNCFDRTADKDVASDGMVHGLRGCQDGDWLYQRDADTFFVTEESGFLDALTPLATAFANHGREDLFVQLMETLHKHWQTAAGAAASPGECKLGPTSTCAKDGADTYEPLLAKIFSSDLLTSLNKLTAIAAGVTVPACSAVDAAKHTCASPGALDGIGVLGAATRGLVDPGLATAFGVTDSTGKRTSARNDGKTNTQVTPLYLVLEALNEVDAAFAAAPQTAPPENRRDEWRQARSQLVDELLSVNSANMPGLPSSFADPALPRITPVLIDVLRAQLLARCGADETTGKCPWARGLVQTPVLPPPASASQPAVPLWNAAVTTLSGPLFASVMDLLDALRRDPGARAAEEDLLAYLVDPASVDAVGKVEALTELLSSSHDLLQVLNDADNLMTPVYRVFSSAFVPPAQSSYAHPHAAVDATTSLLTRLAGRAFDASHREVCASEVDPNDVVSLSLAHLVTPMPGGETPLEVIVDAIADVNRAGDSSSSLLLRQSDYANISGELGEFLLDPQRGLEQLYEIVRQGTEH